MDFEEVVSLKEECLACRKCSIGGVETDGRISNVFSNMNSDSDIMIIGQSPGACEVKQGEPFVGISGKTFDKLLMESIGMDRSRFYVSNVVRCFSGRKPNRIELENCRTFLDREIAFVFPSLIVTLGGLAFSQVTGMSGITKNRGKVIFSIRYGVPVMAMVQPSPFNTGSVDGKNEFREDLKVLGSTINRIDSGENLFG